MISKRKLNKNQKVGLFFIYLSLIVLIFFSVTFFTDVFKVKTQEVDPNFKEFNMFTIELQSFRKGPSANDCVTERAEEIGDGDPCVTECFVITPEIHQCHLSYGYSRYDDNINDWYFFHAFGSEEDDYSNCEDLLEYKVNVEKDLRTIAGVHCIPEMGVHLGIEPYKERDHLACVGNDAYWLDSANNPFELVEDCGSDFCEEISDGYDCGNFVCFDVTCEINECVDGGCFKTIDTRTIELDPDVSEELLEQLRALEGEVQSQANLINQLKLTQSQNAVIISQLNLNIADQAELITAMELTAQEQAELINTLQVNIADQAQLINELTTNLETKALLIDALQVENENQAQLIAEMRLSFEEQGSIITLLEGTIEDDLEIITALTSEVSEQAEIIRGMQLNNEEQAEIIKRLELNAEELNQIIDNLELNLEEKERIISELEESLLREQELTKELEELRKQELSSTSVYWIMGLIVLFLIGLYFIKKK